MTIEILPTEKRCRPFTRECPRRTDCARALAARGGIDEPDLSVEMRVQGAWAYCPNFLSVDKAAADVAKSRIKRWPGSAP